MTDITETEARDIARRWGQASASEPLLAFAETGLIADRKRLAEAIKGLRVFVKHPDELDCLLAWTESPTDTETAAREAGWGVENDRICHVHDLDRNVCYRTWEECCAGEDIEPRPLTAPRGRRRRAR
jgi:hypothetical protein